MEENLHPASVSGLDPSDWKSVRAQGHRMLDDILDYVEHIRERPVWQPIPDDVRAHFRTVAPVAATDLAAVHDEFMRYILPFATGNSHPGFMGWLHGGGNVPGLLAEMLAAGLNANLGGRDHVPIEVERQIVQWVRQFFEFPETASGLFVTGTSMANLLGVLVARTAMLGAGVRRHGVAAGHSRLTAYTSAASHGSVTQAMDLSGLGTEQLRVIPINRNQQIDLGELERAIAADRRAGFTPFLVIGTAGTVDIGAIDDLAGLSRMVRREKLWLHVDGAYGALAILAPDIAPRLVGIECADSIALDFHKWAQVPYDAGFILVRDGTLHRDTFASPAAYLRRETRGLAAGTSWPCDLGPDLSRGFRALKTWFTLKVHGTDAIGAVISRTCVLARYLERKVIATPELELLAPVALNIVCFRYRGDDANRLNASIVADLHESGLVAPSTTMIDGCLAIRAAIVNHRTSERDMDALINATVAFGDAYVRSCAA
jgi:aromatic-L-amino-acid/L-tryptophan decarboxylase